MTNLTSIQKRYSLELETIRLLNIAAEYDDRFLHTDNFQITTFGIALALLIGEEENNLSNYYSCSYIDLQEFLLSFLVNIEDVDLSQEDKYVNEILEKAEKTSKGKAKKITIDQIIVELLLAEKSAGFILLLEIEETLEGMEATGAIKKLQNSFSKEKLLNNDPRFGAYSIEKGEEYELLSRYQIESFCKVLNSEKNIGTPPKILKRDKEIEKLWMIISKARKRNAILVGEPGVGKSAIIEAITHQIDNGTCPKQYLNYKVVSLDVQTMIAGCRYIGDSQKHFKYLLNFLRENQNVILFIDEAHVILGAGASSEDNNDLANALKPILTTNEAIVIGATTNYEYEKYFSRDPALKRRFIKLEVKEPKLYEVYDMIKNQVEFLAKAHGVTIPSKRFVENVILNASCYDLENQNPDRSIDLMDRIMANAKLKGRKVVGKRDIDEVFYENVNKFKKMTQYEKECTAYHEAGHFIAHYFFPEMTQEIIAVTIIPTDDYLGATVYERKENVTQTVSYYKAEITVYLAGRIAEKLVSGELSSGAREDLEKANKLAREMVTEFGFISSEKIQENSTLKNVELSEVYKNEIQKESDKIIKEVTRVTEKFIKEHKELIDVIAKELMKKGILGPKDLKKLVPKLEETKVI